MQRFSGPLPFVPFLPVCLGALYLKKELLGFIVYMQITFNTINTNWGSIVVTVTQLQAGKLRILLHFLAGARDFSLF
jgi:hypothetical protein